MRWIIRPPPRTHMGWTPLNRAAQKYPHLIFSNSLSWSLLHKFPRRGCHALIRLSCAAPPPLPLQPPPPPPTFSLFIRRLLPHPPPRSAAVPRSVLSPRAPLLSVRRFPGLLPLQLSRPSPPSRLATPPPTHLLPTKRALLWPHAELRRCTSHGCPECMLQAGLAALVAWLCCLRWPTLLLWFLGFVASGVWCLQL
jgi:hypothetical protein